MSYNTINSGLKGLYGYYKNLDSRSDNKNNTKKLGLKSKINFELIDLEGFKDEEDYKIDDGSIIQVAKIKKMKKYMNTSRNSKNIYLICKVRIF